MVNFTLFNFQILDLFYYFLIYAFMGWCIETIYATLRKGKFVNRGFLNGPFCPIYGFGALILIVALNSVLNNILLLFVGAIVLTSVLEYITGFVLEKVFKGKWWDYSSESFNINGRVCLKFSVYWGVISVFMLRLLQPEVNSLVHKIPYIYGILGFYGLVTYFLADFAITLRSIIRLNSLLNQMHEISMEVKEKLELIAENSIEEIENTIYELKETYEMLLTERSLRHQRLLKAFPNLKIKHYDQILQDIKDRINQPML